MASSDSRSEYPAPDRSDHTPQKNIRDQYFPEADLGAGKGKFSDGRPYLFENWLDMELELYLRTVFYSTLNAEDWDAAQHRSLLDDHGLLEGQAEEFREVELSPKKILDASNNEMWSVSIAIRYEEE